MPSQRRAEEDPTNKDLFWDPLLLSLDMHNRENDPSEYNLLRQPDSDADDIETTALFAQMAAANMFPPSSSYANQNRDASEYPGQSSQRHYIPPGTMPSTSYGRPPPPPQPYPYLHGDPSASASHGHSYGPPSPVESIGGGRTRASRASHAPPQAGASTSSPDAEELDEYEDKRRRNTAASARFRIKKKQRTLALERQVGDLTGRAEELEREAADLRRENGWLKEIVMLKGGRINVSGFPSGEGSRRRSERRGQRAESEENEESESESSEEEQPSRGKGKGKGKSKKK